jgi:uncharacterized membrane protein HdeD (DUF308 family)
MLMSSVIFVLIAVCLGLLMAFRRYQGGSTYPAWLPLLHFATVGVGAVLVILVALKDHSLALWSNIAVAVVVSALGLLLSHGKLRGTSAKTLLAVHGALAICCTLFLLFNTF